MNWPALRTALMTWYDAHKRDLPWRGAQNPYHIWLSEIMAQQTTLAAVIPYFHRFIARWPSVEALAAADRDDVLAEWAGLGYYARARNLHACAQAVAARAGFPRDVASLQALPGIGPYTAVAIAAQAFDVPGIAVDGNVERVMARLLRLAASGPKLKTAVAEAAHPLACAQRPGDTVQALMELGATVCTPRSPKCGACPWQSACLAHAANVTSDYPRKPAKTPKPQRYGVVYLLTCGDEIYVEQRPETGLLGGYWAPPTSAWEQVVERSHPSSFPLPLPPGEGSWAQLGTVAHVFTHFALELTVLHANQTAKPPLPGRWAQREDLRLPTVFQKSVNFIIDKENALRQ